MDIPMICDYCGSDVKAEFGKNAGHTVMIVSPCDSCLESRARDEGLLPKEDKAEMSDVPTSEMQDYGQP